MDDGRNIRFSCANIHPETAPQSSVLATPPWRGKPLLNKAVVRCWRLQYQRGIIYYNIKERNQFAFCSSTTFSRAWASWSGHDVDLKPQRMPLSRLMASSILMPRTRTEIPCVLPLHPPSYCTSEMMSSSKVIWMAEEQTPFVRYTNDFVIILYRTLDDKGFLLQLRRLLRSRRRAENIYPWENCT